jgi:hypothetical protein
VPVPVQTDGLYRLGLTGNVTIIKKVDQALAARRFNWRPLSCGKSWRWIMLKEHTMPRPVTITLWSLAAACLCAFTFAAAIMAH